MICKPVQTVRCSAKLLPIFDMYLSTKDAAGVSGLTIRQLQYADERKFIKPIYVHNRRAWPIASLLRLMLYEELAGKMGSIVAKRMIRTISAKMIKAGGYLAISRVRAAAPQILCLADSGAVISHLVTSNSGCIVVSLDDLMHRLNLLLPPAPAPESAESPSK